MVPSVLSDLSVLTSGHVAKNSAEPYINYYIEECFSKVKALLKSMETTCQDDLESDTLAAFSYITPDDCRGWISDSGIYDEQNY